MLHGPSLGRLYSIIAQIACCDIGPQWAGLALLGQLHPLPQTEKLAYGYGPVLTTLCIIPISRTTYEYFILPQLPFPMVVHQYRILCNIRWGFVPWNPENLNIFGKKYLTINWYMMKISLWQFFNNFLIDFHRLLLPSKRLALMTIGMRHRTWPSGNLQISF